MRLGTHLVISLGAYSHHGLYAGRGIVIHYSGYTSSGGNGVVEEITLDDFCEGKECWSVEYKDPAYPYREAVDRARTRMGESRYNVPFNNCEHFVTWCITGKSVSKQVNNVVHAVGSTVATSYASQVISTPEVARKIAAAGVPVISKYAAQEAAKKSAGTLAAGIVSGSIPSVIGGGTAAGVVGLVGGTVGAPVLAVGALAVGAGWVLKKIFED